MKSALGHLTVVQESRFILETDDGKGLRFILARGANLEAEALGRLLAAGTRVSVQYEGEPGLASGVAYGVRGAGSHDGPTGQKQVG